MPPPINKNFSWGKNLNQEGGGGKYEFLIYTPVHMFSQLAVKVDWFEDRYKEIQKKIHTREGLANKKEMEEFTAVLRQHRWEYKKTWRKLSNQNV